MIYYMNYIYKMTMYREAINGISSCIYVVSRNIVGANVVEVYLSLEDITLCYLLYTAPHLFYSLALSLSRSLALSLSRSLSLSLSLQLSHSPVLSLSLSISLYLSLSLSHIMMMHCTELTQEQK